MGQCSKMLFVLLITIFIKSSKSIAKFPNGSCALGDFPCHNSNQCIPQRHWCDDQVHCDDRSDELSCADTRGDEVINRKHRKRPGADSDELPHQCYFHRKPPSSSTNSNLNENPSSCRCIRNDIVCRHLHLKGAPPIADFYNLVGKRIELLDLGGNEFQRTTYATFETLKESRIRSLVLQHCSIEILIDRCFHDVLSHNLEELYLDGNRLKHLNKNVFDVVDNKLRLLSIGHNSISSIHAEAFRNLRNLIELDLRNNQIEKLNSAWFSTLYNLLNLNLQGNLLTQLDTSSWPVFRPLFPSSISISTASPTSRYTAFVQTEGSRFPFASSTFSPSGTNTNSSSASEKFSSETLITVSHLIPLDTDDGYLREEVEIQDNEKDINLNLNVKNNSEVKIFGHMLGLSKLETLSLANNRITRLDDEGFDVTPMSGSLINLDLSENRLQHITNTTFKGLKNLLVLTLNQNSLSTISNNAFIWMPNLTSLDLSRNEDIQLNQRIFSPLGQLTHLYFDTFEMCGYALHVKVCEPKGDGISTKENLLDSIILRASVWIMALIGFVGNLIVLLGRQFITKHTNVVDSLHIKNLAISDLLMSVYLFIIASVDEYYRGDYLANDKTWRASNFCTISGFLNTLSGESSVLILSLVTWDRYVSVTRPFPRNQLSFKFVALRLVTLWLIAGTVAILPVIKYTHSYFENEFYNANGVCLPLYLHNPFGKGWEYSVVMFVFVNLTALAFISYAYLRMIREIRVSTVACRCWRTTQQMQERDRVAQHLGIIVFTDCLCWVPVITIKLATLAGLKLSRTYRNFVYASLAIYIMPINSALNPILYTFATPLFTKQVTKLMQICCKRKKKRPDGHSGSDSAFSLSLGILGSNTRRVLTYRGTQTSNSGSKTSWRKQPQAV